MKPAREAPLTVKEVCAFLKISRTTLWKIEKRGELTPSTVGLVGKRFKPGDVEAYLERQQAKQREKNRLPYPYNGFMEEDK